VLVLRFSCGFFGHLCTFPWGLDSSFKVIWPFFTSLHFNLRSCFVPFLGELTNYNWVHTDQSSPDFILLGSCFKQLHVRGLI
jgi:hypothetical protein